MMHGMFGRAGGGASHAPPPEMGWEDDCGNWQTQGADHDGEEEHKANLQKHKHEMS